MTFFDGENRYNHLSFSQLNCTSLTCTECHLHQTRNNVVFGSGNPKSLLMAIGEGPGEKEDLQGTPFIGRSGKLLTELFKTVGLDREKDVFITNIVKCRPPNNRDPQKDEINACSSILKQQIQCIKPKIILLIGSPSMKTVLGSKHLISKSRGQWFKQAVNYMDELVYIMPIYHPSYLLRSPSKEVGKPKWKTKQDLLEVKRIYDFYKSTLPH